MSPSESWTKKLLGGFTSRRLPCVLVGEGSDPTSSPGPGTNKKRRLGEDQSVYTELGVDELEKEEEEEGEADSSVEVEKALSAELEARLNETKVGKTTASATTTKRGRGHPRKVHRRSPPSDLSLSPKKSITKLKYGKRSTRKRQIVNVDGDDDDEDELDSANDEAISSNILRLLNDPSKGQTYKRAVIEDQDLELRIGDIVATQGLSGPKDIWLAEITDIRGLHRDLEDAIDEVTGEVILNKKTGAPQKRAKSLYVLLAWAYKKKDFLHLKKQDPHRSRALKWMGSDERVLTDHKDWNRPEDIIGVVKCYEFDDSFPAFTTDHSMQHASPLSLWSPRRPVTYKLPSTFFGDDPSLDDGAFWFRVRFSFGPGGEKKNKTLSFNKHSGATKPYNPSEPQVFSSTVTQWFDVSYLLKHKHFADVQVVDPAPFLRDTQGDYHDSHLKIFARSSIRRGGAYGLIGNICLVMTARALVEEAQGRTEGVDNNAVEDILQNYREWASSVQARILEGEKDGEPPKGMTWVCPKTGDAI